MQLTREGDYGIRAVAYLAGSKNGSITSATIISEKKNIPPKFLARIMPKLVRGGIVISIPGSKGGYKLARESRLINCLEVLEALEGELRLNLCLDKAYHCALEGQCHMSDVWLQGQNLLKDYFKGITFDIVGDAT